MLFPEKCAAGKSVSNAPETLVSPFTSPISSLFDPNGKREHEAASAELEHCFRQGH